MQVKVPRGAIIAPLVTPSSVKNFAGVVNEVKKIKSSGHGEISKCALTCCFATPLRRKRPIPHQRLKPRKLSGRIFYFLSS